MVYCIGITSLYMKIMNCQFQFSWNLEQWEFKSFPTFSSVLHVWLKQAGKKHAQFETFKLIIYYRCHYPSHLRYTSPPHTHTFIQSSRGVAVVRDEMHYAWNMNRKDTLHVLYTQSCHLLSYLRLISKLNLSTYN